jgi:hypothetical protein
VDKPSKRMAPLPSSVIGTDPLNEIASKKGTPTSCRRPF